MAGLLNGLLPGFGLIGQQRSLIPLLPDHSSHPCLTSPLSLKALIADGFFAVVVDLVPWLSTAMYRHQQTNTGARYSSNRLLMECALQRILWFHRARFTAVALASTVGITSIAFNRRFNLYGEL